MTLPAAFLDRPIAHRALHDRAAGRIENSHSAIAAAIEGGWGIEIDLQLSRDGVPMVFHDYDLGRLTGTPGPLALHTAADLGGMTLTGGTDRVPTLAAVLAQVAGAVPILIEIKDQDGALGPNIGPLEEATAKALRDYAGPVAVMSFNPHSVAHMARIAPQIPRGLTTDAFAAEDWPMITPPRREELARIDDIGAVGASFISHRHTTLGLPRIAEIKTTGLPVLCWTIRSAEEEARARRIADNVTFEGYLP